MAEILDHGWAEPAIRDQVGGISFARQVAALQFMRPLGASLDPGQTALNGVVNGAVITNLEMQHRVMDHCAPIAAVKSIAAEQIERPTHDLAVFLTHD